MQIIITADVFSSSSWQSGVFIVAGEGGLIPFQIRSYIVFASIALFLESGDILPSSRISAEWRWIKGPNFMAGNLDIPLC